LSIGNSRWPPPQDIVYIGPYGKTSELTNPPTVVVNKHAAKFGSKWPNGFRGEDGNVYDRRQVMAIAHMTLQVR
jgi:hypothetical protein